VTAAPRTGHEMNQWQSPAAEKCSRRIPELDGVRGMAILLVLIWHYAVVTLSVRPDSVMSYVLGGLSFSWSGVDLFFVLSGFLIGGILLDNREAKNYFRVFYMRRTCRIFPLYFIWFMIFCDLLLAEGILFSEERFRWLLANPLPLLSYLTFTQNIPMALQNVFGPNWMAVTWSLAIEEQCHSLFDIAILASFRGCY
jgi:peptidoglycan/LPS O-acetylase OafA/YrhL